MHASGGAQEGWETERPCSNALTGRAHIDQQTLGQDGIDRLVPGACPLPGLLAPLSEEEPSVFSPVAELLTNLIQCSQILSRWIVLCEPFFDDPAMSSFH